MHSRSLPQCPHPHPPTLHQHSPSHTTPTTHTLTHPPAPTPTQAELDEIDGARLGAPRAGSPERHVPRGQAVVCELLEACYGECALGALW